MSLPEQTIAWLRQAARLGQAGALADLDAIARLDALEARVALLEHVEADEPDDEPQTLTLHRVALKMVDTLEQLGVIPEIRGTLRRAILEPMEPEAQPAEDAAPAGGLVERIAFTAGCGNGTARAVILEVAAWLDRRGQHGCSLWLRELCLISQEGQANG
jgi:hypothetical protein